jgi:predicted phage-related endonuclease
MTIRNLDSVRAQVEMLRYVRRQKAKLKEVEDLARPAVEEAMGGADVGTLDDEIVIRWGTYKSRRLDQKALADAHPDIVEEFKVASEQRKFEVVDE